MIYECHLPKSKVEARAWLTTRTLARRLLSSFVRVSRATNIKSTAVVALQDVTFRSSGLTTGTSKGGGRRTSRARDTFSQTEDYIDYASSAECLGRAYFARGKYAKAAAAYVEAQQIYRQIGAMDDVATTIFLLGWLRGEQDWFEEAERLAWEAATLFRELGREGDLAKRNGFIDGLRRLQPFA